MSKIKGFIFKAVPTLSQPMVVPFAVIAILMVFTISGLYSTIRPEDAFFKICVQIASVIFGFILMPLISGAIHLILSIKNLHIQITLLVFAFMYVVYAAFFILHFGILNEVARILLIFVCLGWILGVYVRLSTKSRNKNQ